LREQLLDTEADDRPVRSARYLALFSLVIFVGGWLSLAISRHTDHAAAIWLPDAFVVAAMMRSRTRQWPYLVAAGAIAIAFANLIAGDDAVTSAVLPLINMVNAAVIAGLLRYWKRDVAITRPVELRTFYFVVVGPASVISALLAATYLHLVFDADFMQTALAWYGAEALGVATIAPILLALRKKQLFMRSDFTEMPGTIALAVLTLATLAVTRAVPHQPVAFLLFPVILLFAFQRGLSGAAICFGIIATVTFANLAVGNQFLAFEAASPHLNFIVLQLFLFTLSVTAMLVGAVLTEREILTAKLEDTNHRLQLSAKAEKHANRSKSEFLANMSHELRTPLNAILGFSEIMRDSALGPRTAQMATDYGRMIHDAGSHLLALINDVLDMSKIEAGKLVLALEPVDLHEQAAKCLAMFELQAEQAKISLHAIRTGDDVVTLADRRAVQQVLLNLVSNAIKFTPAGGDVSIEVAGDAHCVSLCVRDSGIGIPAEAIGRLGRPFEQVRISAAHSQAGTGLGLALVRALAEKHGGQMEIASTMTVGTSVTVTFPRRTTPHASTTSSSGSQVPVAA
jgi:signal transduction histidine kinase